MFRLIRPIIPIKLTPIACITAMFMIMTMMLVPHANPVQAQLQRARFLTMAAPQTPDPLGFRFPVLRERLDNGLRIVMSPDRTVPTVAIAVYYDVGSRNEEKGSSGFAHLFEHMMFQGSANVAKDEHFSWVTNRGGSMNGTTSADRTNYYETLPSNELAFGLWLEADRMRSLNVTLENFENQRQTVMEERRQSYENQPYALSSLRINELAYGDYWPYAHSTIGDMGDLQRAPLSAVQAFWEAHYAPNNAVLSIAGYFDPAEAMALIKKHFGDIASRETPTFNPPARAAQTAERVESMRDPLARLPAFHMAYPIPATTHADHYALEMLGLILGDGESSRLYQLLVKEKEMVQDIYAGTDDRRGPDLFSFWAIMAGNHQPSEARALIDQAVQSIADHGVKAREMQKANNRVLSAFTFGLQSYLSRAKQLAEFEMYRGDASLLLSEIAHYRAVTPDDVKRVAGQYFGATHRTVLDVLTPSASSTPPASSASSASSTGGTQP